MPNGPDGAPIDHQTSQRLQLALSQFRPEEGTSKTDEPTWRRAITRHELPVPRLVHWVLCDFLGTPDGGRAEKTAWRLWFTYGDKPFSLAFEKFGLRLYGAAATENAFHSNADSIIRDLSKAIRVAEKDLFRPFADSQVQAGGLTVLNQFHRLRRMYEYFRSEAERGIRPEEADRRGPHGEFRPFAGDEFRFHQTVAMVNGYFSWLEHTLVLCWPFLDYQPGTDDLASFIGDRWGLKFGRLFDLQRDRQAKSHYDALKGVSEDYRNTYGHGGFDKQGGALMIHVPGGAMVPAMLTHIRDSPSFDLFPVSGASLGQVLTIFDGVDTWLHQGPASFGMEYAEAGLDVPFDAVTLAEYQVAMQSEEAFDEFIYKTSYMCDQLSNMDW